MAKEVFVRIANTGDLFLTEEGYEALSSTPMAPPVGFKKEEPLHLQIKRLVREQRLQEELDAAGHETFEEADDFDVGDDYDPSSPFEIEFDPPEVLRLHQLAEQAAFEQEKPVDPPAEGPGRASGTSRKAVKPSKEASPEASEE